jgi:hypothetical protein
MPRHARYSKLCARFLLPSDPRETLAHAIAARSERRFEIGRSVEDDPARAKFFDELDRKRKGKLI